MPQLAQKAGSGLGGSAPNYITLKDRAAYEGLAQRSCGAPRPDLHDTARRNKQGGVNEGAQRASGPFGSDLLGQRFEIERALQHTGG